MQWTIPPFIRFLISCSMNIYQRLASNFFSSLFLSIAASQVIKMSNVFSLNLKNCSCVFVPHFFLAPLSKSKKIRNEKKPPSILLPIMLPYLSLSLSFYLTNKPTHQRTFSVLLKWGFKSTLLYDGYNWSGALEKRLSSVGGGGWIRYCVFGSTFNFYDLNFKRSETSFYCNVKFII